MPYLRIRHQCWLTFRYRYVDTDIYLAKDMYIYLAKEALLQSVMIIETYTACTCNHIYSSRGIKWATVRYCTTGYLSSALFQLTCALWGLLTCYAFHIQNHDCSLLSEAWNFTLCAEALCICRKKYL